MTFDRCRCAARWPERFRSARGPGGNRPATPGKRQTACSRAASTRHLRVLRARSVRCSGIALRRTAAASGPDGLRPPARGKWRLRGECPGSLREHLPRPDERRPESAATASLRKLRREHVARLVPALGAAADVEDDRANGGQDGDDVADHHARDRQQALGEAVRGRRERGAHQDSPGKQAGVDRQQRS